jgi:hypothetical protein
MAALLRRAFGYYPGEGKNIFNFILLAIISTFSIATAETLSVSLFLKKIGSSNLPFAYTIQALGMLCMSCLFIYVSRRMSSNKILISVYSIATTFFIAIAFFLSNSNSLIFFYVLQVVTCIILAAYIASFWTFIDKYHDLQDAKRKYGLYNAAYFSGYIISGIFINYFFDKLGPNLTYIVIVLGLIFSICQVINISKKTASFEDDNVDDLFSGGKNHFKKLFKIFFNSPYALVVVFTSIVVQLLLTCTEFTYMKTFDTVFDVHNVDVALRDNFIAEFLSKCKAYISFGNIIIGMFVYRKMVRRIGLCNMVILPSILFFALYSKWLFIDTIVIAVLAVIADEGILYAIEDNNFNLLVTAAPSKLKGTLRIVNDSFFEPIGMLLSSIFLIFLQNNSKIFGLCLSVLFVTAAFLIRYFYPKSIQKNIHENSISFEKKILDFFAKYSKKEKKDFIKDLFKILKNEKNESLKVLAIKSLLTLERPNLLKDICNYADNVSYSAKIKLLKIFEKSEKFCENSYIIELIYSWKDLETEPLLVKTSHLYLAKKGLLHPQKVSKDLDSEDIYLRAAAIITLKQSLADNLENVGLNHTIAHRELDLLLKSNVSDEILMGLEILSTGIGKEHILKAIDLLAHQNPSIKIKAASTLSKIADKSLLSFTGVIINHIKNSPNNEFKKYLLKILGKIGDSSTVKDIILTSIHFKTNEKRLTENIIINMGLKTVPILLSILKDENINDRCRILTSKILSKISPFQLKANLYDIISKEILRAHFYYYFANSVEIEKNYKKHDLSLFKNFLNTNYQSVVDFITHLLGAVYNIENIDTVVHTLHSKNEKEHAQAVETLERKVENKLFKQIRPLIDDVPKVVRLQAYKNMTKLPETISLNDLLDILEKSSKMFDKTISAHLKTKLKLPNWKESLTKQIKTCDESFHHFASELIER